MRQSKQAPEKTLHACRKSDDTRNLDDKGDSGAGLLQATDLGCQGQNLGTTVCRHHRQHHLAMTDSGERGFEPGKKTQMGGQMLSHAAGFQHRRTMHSAFSKTHQEMIDRTRIFENHDHQAMSWLGRRHG